MIRTFRDSALKRYWNTGKSKGIPAQDLPKITRILTSLNAATSPADMNLPLYRFHQLKGNRRVTFEWENGAAVRVDLEDYHGD
jgi:proteic killer suppression protein